MKTFIEISKEKSKTGNPKKVKKICEWSGDEFWVTWKKRNARFKDMKSMYEWRKSQNHETVKCLNCGNSFDRYKNILHYSSGLPQQYCSNECNRSSKEKKEKLKKWANSIKNHFNDQKIQQKGKDTRLEKYGDINYNNMEQHSKTMLKNHGVPYATYLPQTQSNGKTISKGQRQLYEKIKIDNPDAKLEHYLPDVKLSVDIFIPENNQIVEYFGDYWHCNPKKYKKDYYHTQVHKTANEIWKHDVERINFLKDNGYNVKVVWENEKESL